MVLDGRLTPQALNAMNPLNVDDPESGGLNHGLQLGPPEFGDMIGIRIGELQPELLAQEVVGRPFEIGHLDVDACEASGELREKRLGIVEVFKHMGENQHRELAVTPVKKLAGVSVDELEVGPLRTVRRQAEVRQVVINADHRRTVRGQPRREYPVAAAQIQDRRIARQVTGEKTLSAYTKWMRVSSKQPV